jgi:hypothetical protein
MINKRADNNIMSDDQRGGRIGSSNSTKIQLEAANFGGENITRRHANLRDCAIVQIGIRIRFFMFLDSMNES